MTDSKADKRSRKGEKPPAFVDLPNGIFTLQGVWFHTRVEDLRQFCGDLLKHVSLEKLLADAAAWLRSPATFALWVFLLGVMLRSPVTAVVAGVTGYIGWGVLSPGLVLRPLVALARVLQHPIVVGAAYVLGLSWLSSGGQTVGVVAGLLWFILVRWGVVEKILSPAVSHLRKRLYRLPAPDQILRGLIIRHALAHRVSVGDLDAMERRILEIANRHRKP
ncbi:MAG: hypothetical protein HKN29_06040 [Rhodothermales bacterium]|nr:hypothetical protein [Rhodothermales bacterium]